MRVTGATLLAAIGMMAIGSGAARAEIVVEGQPPGGHRSLAGLLIGPESIRTAGGVQILCNNGGTFNSLILSNNIIHTTRLYYGCVTVGMPQCIVYETANDAIGGLNPGHWIEKTLGVFAESEGSHYLVSEKTEELLGTIYLETKKGSKEACPLPFELALTGTTAYKASDILEKLIVHKFEPVGEKEEKALKVQLFLGKEKAFVEEGGEEVELTGEYEGLKWWLK